jgi:hypothetical protein
VILCRIQHILNKYSIPRGGIVNKNVGDSADELAVLYYGRARHECGQVGTTHFYNFLTDLTLFVKKIVLCGSILAYILTQTNTEKLFFDFFNAY